MHEKIKEIRHDIKQRLRVRVSYDPDYGSNDAALAIMRVEAFRAIEIPITKQMLGMKKDGRNDRPRTI